VTEPCFFLLVDTWKNTDFNSQSKLSSPSNSFTIFKVSLMIALLLLLLSLGGFWSLLVPEFEFILTMDWLEGTVDKFEFGDKDVLSCDSWDVGEPDFLEFLFFLDMDGEVLDFDL